MSRNYRKEYDNYHSRPEQKIRRAARNAARARFKDADPNKDVHHKDNNPLNNDKNNLSLVTQHYNRREPRLREGDATEGALRKLEGQYFRNKVAQLIQISGRNDTAGLETKIMYQSSDALRKSTRAFQLHFQKQRSSSVRELIAKAVNKAMDKKDIFQVWDAPFAKMITAFGEDVNESFTSSPGMIAVVHNGKIVAKGSKSAMTKKFKELKKKYPKDAGRVGKLKLVSAPGSKYKVGSVWEDVQESFDSDAMINLMQKYLNTKNKNEKKILLKQINRYQKKLGLKVTEDMGTVTGPHIAGTGDDSSTVKVRKKKVRRRKTENRLSPSMKDWEKRQQLSKQIRQKFWKSFRKDKKKDVKLKFKLKNSRSLRKRIIDNVLAIQQKV
jgi:hypothetical protein|tara:strand:- start:793 stop:1944 length:1152 start_codon:yes stop_codon:yes gene_type:complete